MTDVTGSSTGNGSGEMLMPTRVVMSASELPAPGNPTVSIVAPPSGPTGVPVGTPVTVNTVSKYLDPAFLLNAFLCASGVVMAVIDVLPSSGPIDWRVTAPKVLLAIFGAITSFLRQHTNTVTAK